MEQFHDESTPKAEKKLCPKCKNSGDKYCSGCLGEGRIDSDFRTCPVCQGNPKGQKNHECHACDSFGYVGQYFIKCRKCNGSGILTEKEKMCDLCFGMGSIIEFGLSIELINEKIEDLREEEE
jgi:RecJ-like exonuclease